MPLQNRSCRAWVCIASAFVCMLRRSENPSELEARTRLTKRPRLLPTMTIQADPSLKISYTVVRPGGLTKDQPLGVRFGYMLAAMPRCRQAVAMCSVIVH